MACCWYSHTDGNHTCDNPGRPLNADCPWHGDGSCEMVRNKLAQVNQIEEHDLPSAPRDR